MTNETSGFPEDRLGMQTLYSEAKWRQYAACLDELPEVHSPDPTDTTAIMAAKQICANCIVIDECLVSAITHDEEYGIWAGLSEHDRGYHRSLNEFYGVSDVVAAIRTDPILLERMPLLLPRNAREVFVATVDGREPVNPGSASRESGDQAIYDWLTKDVTDRIIEIGTMLLDGSFDYHRWYTETRGSGSRNVITFLLKIDVPFDNEAPLEVLRAAAQMEVQHHFGFTDSSLRNGLTRTAEQKRAIIVDLYGLDNGLSLSSQRVADANSMKRTHLEGFLGKALKHYADNRPKDRLVNRASQPGVNIESEPADTPKDIMRRAVGHFVAERQVALTMLLGLAPDGQQHNDIDIADYFHTTLEVTRRELKSAVAELGNILRDSDDVLPTSNSAEVTVYTSSTELINADNGRADFYKAIIPMAARPALRDIQNNGAKNQYTSIVITHDNAITVNGRSIALTPNDVCVFNLLLLLGDEPLRAVDYKATDIVGTQLAEDKALGVQLKELARKLQRAAGFPLMVFEGSGNQRTYSLAIALEVEDSRVHTNDLTCLTEKLQENRDRALNSGDQWRKTIDTKNSLADMKRLVIKQGDWAVLPSAIEYHNDTLGAVDQAEVVSDYAHFASIAAIYPPLGREDESTLFRTIHGGVDIYRHWEDGIKSLNGYRAIKNAVVAYDKLQLSNLSVVKIVIDRLFNEFDPKKVGVLAGDLLQEGAALLATCVTTYDVNRGSKFSDYAGGVIYSNLRSLRESSLQWGNAAQLKAPGRIQKAQAAARKAGSQETGVLTSGARKDSAAAFDTLPITDDMLQIADESDPYDIEKSTQDDEIAAQLTTIFDSDILSDNEKIILSLYFQVYAPSLTTKFYQARLSVDTYAYDTVFSQLANQEKVSLDDISRILLLPRGTALNTKQRAIKKIVSSLDR